MKKRNSSIELLRIISMLMIIAHHYIVGSQINTLEDNLSFNKLFADCVLRPGGKIGVVIFFLITAWFLSSSKKTSFEKCLCKVLQIEKEMLFWSIVASLFTFIFWRQYFQTKYFLICFFPTLFRLWWYPTSYIIFLLIFPFLHTALQKINQKVHKRLCCVLFFIWGIVAGILPNINLDIVNQNMLIFIYIYILVSYYRWYMKPITIKQSIALIGISYLLIILNIIICSILFQYTQIHFFAAIADTWISHEWKIPVLGIAFGLFNYFISEQFSSQLINIIASTTFGIFLIHNHPLIQEILSHSLFDFSTYYDSRFFCFLSIGIVLIIFLIGMILDLARQRVFTFLSKPFIKIDTVVLNIYRFIKKRLLSARIFDD